MYAHPKRARMGVVKEVFGRDKVSMISDKGIEIVNIGEMGKYLNWEMMGVRKREEEMWGEEVKDNKTIFSTTKTLCPNIQFIVPVTSQMLYFSTTYENEYIFNYLFGVSPSIIRELGDHLSTWQQNSISIPRLFDENDVKRGYCVFNLTCEKVKKYKDFSPYAKQILEGETISEKMLSEAERTRVKTRFKELTGKEDYANDPSLKSIWDKLTQEQFNYSSFINNDWKNAYGSFGADILVQYRSGITVDNYQGYLQLMEVIKSIPPEYANFYLHLKDFEGQTARQYYTRIVDNDSLDAVARSLKKWYEESKDIKAKVSRSLKDFTPPPYGGGADYKTRLDNFVKSFISNELMQNVEKLESPDLLSFTLEERIKLLKLYSSLSHVGGNKEKLLIKLLFSASEKDQSELLNRIEADPNFFNELRYSIDDENRALFYQFISLVIIRQMGVEKYVKEYQAILALYRSKQASEKVLPFASPGLIRQIFDTSHYYKIDMQGEKLSVVVESTNPARLQAFLVSSAIGPIGTTLAAGTAMLTKYDLLKSLSQKPAKTYTFNKHELVGINIILEREDLNQGVNGLMVVPAQYLWYLNQIQEDNEMEKALDALFIILDVVGVVATGGLAATAFLAFSVTDTLIRNYRSEIKKWRYGSELLDSWQVVQIGMLAFGAQQLITHGPSLLTAAKNSLVNFKNSILAAPAHIQSGLKNMIASMEAFFEVLVKNLPSPIPGLGLHPKTVQALKGLGLKVAVRLGQTLGMNFSWITVDGFRVIYKDVLIFEGKTAGEVDNFVQKLAKMSEGETGKYLDDLVRKVRAGYKVSKEGLELLARKADEALELIDTSADDLLKKFPFINEKGKFSSEELTRLDKILSSSKERNAKMIRDKIRVSNNLTANELEGLKEVLIAYRNAKVPGVVGILEGTIQGKNGERIFIQRINYTSRGMNKEEIINSRHTLVHEWLTVDAQKIIDKGKSITVRTTHGKCAEPINISQFLFEAEKVLGMKPNTMKIEQARELFEGSVSFAKRIDNVNKPMIHMLDKEACSSCNPLLKYFNIKVIH
jgi:hypothetical protein